MDFIDHNGTPRTTAELRAAFDIPADQPVTAELLDQVIQISEQQLGEGAISPTAFVAPIVSAIRALERRIADLEEKI